LLVRVTADIARLVPLSFFILVPMMEFALPIALRLFPNLLPSTFEEKHHAEEKRMKLLKVRLEMAQLLEHTLEERAAQVTAQERSKKRKEAEAAEAEKAQAEGGISLVEKRARETQRDAERQLSGGRMPEDVRRFMLQMREGGVSQSSSEELLTMMRGFKDNVTLDHLYRDQLVSMARFLGMNAFAPTAILRFQVRQRLRKLRNEDRDIMWEGVDTLRDEELVQDLRTRGLPTLNLSKGQMRTTLSNWLQLSQKKEIPYTLLILTNMLHFAGTREEQEMMTDDLPSSRGHSDAQIDVVAAQAALSSLSPDLADKSTLVSQVDVSNDEKLQALRREEELIEEERIVAQSYVKPEELSGEDEDDHKKAAAKEGKPKKAAKAQLELSHDQVGEIAEAVELMAADSPVAKERLEVERLNDERECARERIEEGKKQSRTVAMLDDRVSAMLERLQLELKETESSIGEAFHTLDLDADGVVTHAELLTAMEELHTSKRPNAAAFQEMLNQIDIDDDGKISVQDFKRLIREMQNPGGDDDDLSPSSQQPNTSGAKSSAKGGE